MTAPAHFTVTVERARLLALGTDPSGPVNRAWVRLMARIDANAKRKLSGDYLHVRTGNLRSSQAPPFVAIMGDTITGVAANIASYAAALHQGSREHDILPVRAKMLRFIGRDGAPVFRAIVHHPGTKAKPWLRDAMNEELARPL